MNYNPWQITLSCETVIQICEVLVSDYSKRSAGCVKRCMNVYVLNEHLHCRILGTVSAVLRSAVQQRSGRTLLIASDKGRKLSPV